MVQLSRVLARVPVIKFRKGGVGRPSVAPAAAPAAAPPAAGSCSFKQPASAPMSTKAISDIDLPLRYRRQPLTQEEIDHINGGGIKDPSQNEHQQRKSAAPKALAVLKVPRGVLIQSGKKQKEVVTLNIILQKTVKKD